LFDILQLICAKTVRLEQQSLKRTRIATQSISKP